jgi:hypothetical protein
VVKVVVKTRRPVHTRTGLLVLPYNARAPGVPRVRIELTTPASSVIRPPFGRVRTGVARVLRVAENKGKRPDARAGCVASFPLARVGSSSVRDQIVIT